MDYTISKEDSFMQRYRCPKCGYVFYGKVSKCPHCNAMFRFPGDVNPEEKKEEIVEKKEPENKKEEFSDELISSLVDELHESKAEVNDSLEVEVEEQAKEEKQEIVEESKPIQVHVSVEPPKEPEIDASAPSYFDGRLIQLVGWTILGSLVTIITLGICFPIAYGWKTAWKVNHTVVNGYRQKFIGVAGSLIPRWILWTFLTIITLSIYGWWTPIRLEKWRAERTILIKEYK